MDNKLPIKTNSSFIEKVKLFFKKLFFKEASKDNIIEQTSLQEKENIELQSQISKEDVSKVSNESESLKAIEESIKTIKSESGKNENMHYEVFNQYANDKAKEKFLDDIEDNVDILNTFPIEKLEMLEQYCDEFIEKLERKLRKLKREG